MKYGSNCSGRVSNESPTCKTNKCSVHVNTRILVMLNFNWSGGVYKLAFVGERID